MRGHVCYTQARWHTKICRVIVAGGPAEAPGGTPAGGAGGYPLPAALLHTATSRLTFSKDPT